jgi:serine/threonine protein kinase
MAGGASEFLKHLAASGLLAPDDLARVRVEVQTADVDAQTLAARLVQRKKLTIFHAKHLLAGHFRGFFLEKYKLLEPIARGAMGLVYKAEHTVLRRIAAVKVLPRSAVKNRDAVDRFYREARATAQLQHENIVQVYDVSEQDGIHFIAMEFVPGQSLRNLIQTRSRLAPHEAAGIIRQIALGLEHAMQRGIIHRDIKPSNILVTPRGKAKILDMGLARFFGEAAEGSGSQLSLTHTGVFVGTVDYVAPEQAEDPRNADARSDIYSLGCTFYQSLTGQVPFPHGTAMQKLLKHHREEPVSICTLCPDVPEDLAALVRRMMAKNPAERFQRPGELAEMLRPFLRPRRTPGTPDASAGSGLRAAPPDRTPPLTAPLSSEDPTEVTSPDALLLAPRRDDAPHTETTELDAAPIAFAPPREFATDEAHTAPGTSEILDAIAAMSAESLPAWTETDTRRRWIASLRLRWATAMAAIAAIVFLVAVPTYWALTSRGTIVLAFAASGSAPEEQVRAGRVLLDGKPVPAKGRTEEVIPVDVGWHRISVEWPGHIPVRETVSVRRGQSVRVEIPLTQESRRRAALADLAERVRATTSRDANGPPVAGLRAELGAYSSKYHGTPEAVRAAVLRAELPYPADSLQPEQITAAQRTTLGLAAEDAPELVAVLGTGPSSAVNAVAFSAAGDAIAWGGQDGIVRVWDVAERKEVASLAGHQRPIGWLAFCAGDQRLVSASSDRVQVWEMPSGTESVALPEDGKLTCAAISPDGGMIARGRQDGSIALFDVVAKQAAGRLSGTAGSIASLAFSPQGAVLAAAGTEQIEFWTIPTGRRYKTLPAAAHCVRFGPETELLAVASAREPAALYSLDPNKPARPLSAGAMSVEFSPDGGIIACALAGKIDLWDATTAALKHSIKLGSWAGSVRGLAFSPEQRHIAATTDKGVIAIVRIQPEAAPPAGNP